MRRVATMLSAAAILALAIPALGTDAEQSPRQAGTGGRVVSEMQVAENATVKAVDPEKRLLTLTFSDGSEHTFLVDRSVRKLAQVKVGDVVKTRYREAISVKINKSKVAPETSVQGSVQRDEKSVKPAGTSSLKVTTTATIERVLADGRMVTLRFPDGSSADVQVRDPQNLAKLRSGEVKEGDQIEITYLRALAVSVEKSAK